MLQVLTTDSLSVMQEAVAGLEAQVCAHEEALSRVQATERELLQHIERKDAQLQVIHFG